MTLTLSRRALLATGAAACTLPHAALATPQVLRAGPVSVQLLPEGEPATALLGLNGGSPGPELRVKQGARLDVTFENGIGAPSALHWHGIRISNAMDGVPGMTQPAVADGTSFDYSFTLPDAGTFWYHSHNRSWEQVERGLYGALIVEELTPPDVDHDITVMIDDWRLMEDGSLAEGFGNRHDFAHAGRLGNWATATPSVTTLRAGDRVRLRLINAATARIFPIQITGATGDLVALDGMPLTTPRPLDTLLLAPAQRADAIVDVQEAVRFLFPTDEDPLELGRIDIDGTNPAPRSGPIPTLPPANVVPPQTPAQDLTLTLQGGAMGGMHGGEDIWSFNGVSGMQDTPFATVTRGDTVRIRITNDTAWPHGIHLHGHHFHEVTSEGALGVLRDTTLLQRGETREILCVFDNPGKWLLHCHMLGHQASGMKTWLEVT